MQTREKLYVPSHSGGMEIKMNINNIILSVVIVGVTGLIFGCLLAFASIVFAVKKDEKEEKILAELPGANCGGCGFAGCAACAEAIAKGEAPVNACPVGKQQLAEKLSKIMGVEAVAGDAKVAKVLCNGTCSNTTFKYEYDGPSDCVIAARLGGGPKDCPNGCLGFGTCKNACPFDAIEIVDGIAKINEEKCQACGVCVGVCPKHIIKLVPQTHNTFVLCSNTDKGPAVNKYCTNGCIGCKLCEKNCPQGAVKVVNNCAVIDHELCIDCGVCAEKCPKKVITSKVKSE